MTPSSPSLRIESGPYQFGDDWTGVFIRGDTALHFGRLLDSDFFTAEQKYYLSGLIQLLNSALEEPTLMKEFTECAKTPT